MAIRSCSNFSISNPNFLGVVFALLLVFGLYLLEFFLYDYAKLSVWWAVGTSFFYVMSMWSYVAVVVTDPGSVPVLWGLYNQDPKERKFCMVCHNFKPDRCHHCSKCGQCVLNMDHHCPWINNCVGFYNRKYFLLFIFYLLFALVLALIQMVMVEVSEISAVVDGSRSTNFHTFLRIVTLLFCLVLFVTLFMFFHMHVRMVLENTTTLESMVKERRRRSESEQGKEGKEDQNHYDIGPWYNFTQVFGENIFYWMVPVEEEYFLKGKGVFWEKKDLKHSLSQGSNMETVHLKEGNKGYGMYNF